MKTLLRVMLALVLAVTFAALRPDLSGQAQAQEYRNYAMHWPGMLAQKEVSNIPRRMFPSSLEESQL